LAHGTHEDSLLPSSVVRTFLISDIRGYSTFTSERGDPAAAHLASKFADLARDAVEARGGHVTELMGDGALAEFESVPQAVRAALEFLEACHEATLEDADFPLPVGVGIDFGEVIPVQGGHRGVAINMAARLCSKATAGQVLVTTRIAHIADDQSDLAFESRGSVDLKGFGEPVELMEARSTRRPGGIEPSATPGALLPSQLDDPTTFVDRTREMMWLRGSWRQVRRGHGRILFVSGPAGIGKTRLVAELASHVHRTGGDILYAGSGGAAGAEVLGAIATARSAVRPTLCVVDELNLHQEGGAALAGALEALESRPVLVIGLFREDENQPALNDLVGLVDVRGDGHRRLEPMTLEDVQDIARTYVGDIEVLPTESMLRASGGVPSRVHEVVSEWARDEAKRQLEAAAEWMAAGKTKHAAGIEFANNVIALKLDSIYGRRGADPRTEICPYKGLAAFETADAAYFYGRERLVGELAARTVGMGLLAVVGASGSGKSSAVMAGLLPSLAAGLLPGSERWAWAVMRPGVHPMATLETALESRDADSRLLLVVDQFEEVFTMPAQDGERAAFIDRLVELARDPQRTIVVATIRADYTGYCADYPDLADMLTTNLVLVGPMTPDDLRRAIERPARRVGLHVESALSDALVEELAEEPGGLPLLSTALVELWEARDGDWLRYEDYERTGGVRGAVARLAENAYEQLVGSEREAARVVLLRLVGEGEGDSTVRRRVPVSEFDVAHALPVASVLARLTQDRLLIRDDGMIEIAHEALIREWPRLREWLEEDATGRQLRGHLTQSANQWAERGKDPGDLYRGARLSATLDWADGHDQEVNALEREFLAQGRQASEHEAERQRRTNRRLRGLLVGTTMFLVVALVAGSLALVQRSHARDAQTSAEAQSLRSDAERLGTLGLTEPNLDRSFLLALAGVKLQDLPETRGDLLTLLQRTPALIRFARPSRNYIPALAVSPDGRLLATGDSAGTIHFTDLQTWQTSGDTVQLDGPVTQDAMAFSPESDTLAVATDVGGARSNLYLVDVAARTSTKVGSWPSIPAAAGPPRFTRMAFSPDGSRIAVAVASASPTSFVPVSQRLLLLRVPDGRVVWDRAYPLAPTQNEASVAFTPEGLLVTSAQQGETLLWNAATGRIERRFPIGGPFALSADGHLAAIAENNPDPSNPKGSLALLDLRNGTRRSLAGLPVPGWIVALKFADGDTSVVGQSFDDATRVWDVASGSIVQTFVGQGSGLNLAVTPDGGTALSAAQDGSVAAWDLTGAQRLGRTFHWHDLEAGCNSLPCFAIDPNGTNMAETVAAGRVTLVDFRAQRVVASLPARSGDVADAVAFTPDGGTLVTGGVNGNVTFWDVRTRSVERTLRLPDPVSWVTVSPNGSLLAVETKRPDRSSSRVEVRDFASGDVRYSRELPDGTGAMVFSPDGEQLAALGCCEPGSSIEVWDAQSGAEVFNPQVDGHATTIAFSPDGRAFAAGTENGKVVLWDAETHEQLGPPMQVATGAIETISFSADGRTFAISSGDQTTSLWDLASRKRLGDTFQVEQGSVPVTRFTPQGDLVIDNVADTAVWPTDLETWERFACQVAGRDLTPAEWTDLLPDRPYQPVCAQ
jgi:WD40 repeat protein/class 3 adenylate cyclase